MSMKTFFFQYCIVIHTYLGRLYSNQKNATYSIFYVKTHVSDKVLTHFLPKSWPNWAANTVGIQCKCLFNLSIKFPIKS